MEKFDLNKLNVAIKYIERMANGLNPVNNQPVGNNEVIKNQNVIRCMQFIGEVLEAVRKNDGIIQSKTEKKEEIPFPMETLNLFQYQEDKSIMNVLKQIYEPVEHLNVKKISAVKINECLREEGYLADEINPETGKARKIPTEKGKAVGIYMAERVYDGRAYQAILYNRKAQELVVGKLREMYLVDVR